MFVWNLFVQVLLFLLTMHSVLYYLICLHLCVLVKRVPEPSPPKDGKSRKSRLKGKVCGQCEARTAGLVSHDLSVFCMEQAV